jgi:hypothetical protein
MTGKLHDGTFGVLPKCSKSKGWETVKQKGFAFYDAEQSNKKVDKRLIKAKKFTEDELESFKDEYIKAWSPIKHDEKNLYIDAHY